MIFPTREEELRHMIIEARHEYFMAWNNAVWTCYRPKWVACTEAKQRWESLIAELNTEDTK